VDISIKKVLYNLVNIVKEYRTVYIFFGLVLSVVLRIKHYWAHDCRA